MTSTNKVNSLQPHSSTLFSAASMRAAAMPCPRYSGKTANGDIFGLSSLLSGRRSWALKSTKSPNVRSYALISQPQTPMTLPSSGPPSALATSSTDGYLGASGKYNARHFCASNSVKYSYSSSLKMVFRLNQSLVQLSDCTAMLAAASTSPMLASSMRKPWKLLAKRAVRRCFMSIAQAAHLHRRRSLQRHASAPMRTAGTPCLILPATMWWSLLAPLAHGVPFFHGLLDCPACTAGMGVALAQPSAAKVKLYISTGPICSKQACAT
mmetsp:Transcript_50449/g.113607  ORF Transcript_50449/g.113607 Transcript_50449/m.113607 type:complete len:267 (+) Transcript_50449:541-1341(+)